MGLISRVVQNSAFKNGPYGFRNWPSGDVPASWGLATKDMAMSADLTYVHAGGRISRSPTRELCVASSTAALPTATAGRSKTLSRRQSLHSGPSSSPRSRSNRRAGAAILSPRRCPSSSGRLATSRNVRGSRSARDADRNTTGAAQRIEYVGCPCFVPVCGLFVAWNCRWPPLSRLGTPTPAVPSSGRVWLASESGARSPFASVQRTYSW